MERTLSVSWSDPNVLSQAARAMSGIEFLQAIRDARLPPAPIAEGRLEDSSGRLYAHGTTTASS
ncbi:MAG: hypothetical protein A3G28_08515 [Betaproteobacteria bacterium RIFCSPLOWO2_12_FULL_68_19]|nr:MAG: hypothetical protein A3G28_08515 [Betaproteobacteria bacterium RIFCSPLOWO2_12_FULL_68_19]